MMLLKGKRRSTLNYDSEITTSDFAQEQSPNKEKHGTDIDDVEISSGDSPFYRLKGNCFLI